MDLVVGASKFAAKNLGSLLAQYTLQIRGVRDDIQYINDELASMQAFLNRLKRAATRDEQQEEWMAQVRGVANDIADYVDYVHLRLGGEPRGSGKLVYLRRKWYLITTLYARYCIADDISKFKVRAQHVSERRTRYGVEIPVCDGLGGRPLATIRHRQAPPPPRLIGSVEPVGIEEQLPYFVEMEKQSWCTNQQLTFFAIIGCSGLGKTTLAVALYHRFGMHFDRRASVLASQKFHLQTVLRSLIKQFHEQQADGASKNDLEGIQEWGIEVLKCRLMDLLEGKRYLIFVDDIWSVRAWQSIMDFLPQSVKGSIIVMTTRFRSVGQAVCRSQQGSVYVLNPLNEENSIKLFLQIITRDLYVEYVPTEAATNALLSICRGLPLAIILVAGLVASKLTLESDSTVQIDVYHLAPVDKDAVEQFENKAHAGNDISERLEKILGQVTKDLRADLEKNNCMDGLTHIVNYCYSQLSAELKTCLLYLRMFPKGCLINRKRLIRRWIVEGFITENHGRTTVEAPEDCFNELIFRNLIQAVNYSRNGKVKSCQIPDMVFEYIISKSSEENFVTVVGSQWLKPFPGDDDLSIGAMLKVRWLSIQDIDQQEKIAVERMKLLHVRSLTVFRGFRDLHSILLKFQLLEVLDLGDCKDLSFNHLKKICKMRRLKYVSLHGTEINMLPDMIGMLEYLQVLDIRDTKILELPSSIGNLRHMVHILAGSKSKKIGLKLTEGIMKMTALQTLSGVEICADLATEVLRDLHKLTNLRKLNIYKVSCYTPSSFELLLSAIEHLSSCSLNYLAIDDDFTGFFDTSLIASQAPPEHLHTLGLSGKLSQVPKWIVYLHNLEKLTLSLTSLTTSALKIISGLPELFSLIFTLDSKRMQTSVLHVLCQNAIDSGGEIFVQAGGFEKLKLLCFVTPMLPPLSFLEEAMPKLESLKLRFIMAEGVYGMENLMSLRQVLLTVSSQAPQVAKVMVSQIITLASMHPRNPTVIVNEYEEL